jgi:hypothetical protein
MPEAGRSRVRFTMRPLDFLNWCNPSSRTMALMSTQPLTEMSTRNLPEGKRRPTRKADLTAICESIVYKMWDSRRLTSRWAFAACYRDSFTFYFSKFAARMRYNDSCFLTMLLCLFERSDYFISMRQCFSLFMGRIDKEMSSETISNLWMFGLVLCFMGSVWLRQKIRTGFVRKYTLSVSYLCL